jgi:hypothetical protein
VHCAADSIHWVVLRCTPQKQRLTVIAARFFDYGVRGSHLKTVGMALQVIGNLTAVVNPTFDRTAFLALPFPHAIVQGVMGEILILHTRTPWSSVSHPTERLNPPSKPIRWKLSSVGA